MRGSGVTCRFRILKIVWFRYPGEGPTDVEDAHAPACKSKPNDDDDPRGPSS